MLLGKYFDKRNHIEREPESHIFLTKAPKTFGEMSTEESNFLEVLQIKSFQKLPLESTFLEIG